MMPLLGMPFSRNDWRSTIVLVGKTRSPHVPSKR
jgi:hypothetical protein